MYAYISGTIEKLGKDYVVLEAGGIGYEILTTVSCPEQIGSLGERAKLYTSFQVREDAQTLYGFLSEEEKQLFLQLITVNGIGPKNAMSILNVLSPDELAEAVITGDAKAIARANGVGLKGAQKVILELKDKIALPSFMDGEPSRKGKAGSSSSAVIEVLTTLGYSASEAVRAVRRVPAQEEKTEEQILKEALKFL